jgi:hypothetical protein
MTGHDRFTADILVSLSDTARGTCQVSSLARLRRNSESEGAVFARLGICPGAAADNAPARCPSICGTHNDCSRPRRSHDLFFVPNRQFHDTQSPVRKKHSYVRVRPVQPNCASLAFRFGSGFLRPFFRVAAQDVPQGLCKSQIGILCQSSLS